MKKIRTCCQEPNRGTMDCPQRAQYFAVWRLIWYDLLEDRKGSSRGAIVAELVQLSYFVMMMMLFLPLRLCDVLKNETARILCGGTHPHQSSQLDEKLHWGGSKLHRMFFHPYLGYPEHYFHKFLRQKMFFFFPMNSNFKARGDFFFSFILNFKSHGRRMWGTLIYNRERIQF